MRDGRYRSCNKENTMQDWLWATAADLGRAIEAGKIDPVELCDVYLAAIDALST